MKVGDLVRLCKEQTGMVVGFSNSLDMQQRAKVVWFGGKLNGQIHWVNIQFLEVLDGVNERKC